MALFELHSLQGPALSEKAVSTVAAWVVGLHGNSILLAILVILPVFCKHRWMLAFVKDKGQDVVLPRALQLTNIIR